MSMRMSWRLEVRGSCSCERMSETTNVSRAREQSGPFGASSSLRRFACRVWLLTRPIMVNQNMRPHHTTINF